MLQALATEDVFDHFLAEREGQSWGRTTLTEGDQRFLRASQQCAWKTDSYGPILEDVPRTRRVGKTPVQDLTLPIDDI
jgi:hypothetical protein